jgi:TolB-like protein/Flp pilus assembly protein TadD
MDVLVHMAEHARQVVLREELLARLWPNAVVTDDALTRCFYELRRGLAHAAGDERYRTLLETVPKRGYRLNADVRPLAPVATGEPAPPPPPPRGFRWTVIGVTAALSIIGAALYLWRAPDRSETPAAGPGPYAIAVLPFLDMSEQKDQAYFSDGVTEEILNRLAQAENLRVIARTSSFAVRNANLDVPQIAERLEVSYVLEGSVRKAGGRVRITAQLIDAATNSHTWSRIYDRSVDDLFAVQDEIAVSVAAALQGTLAGSDMRQRTPASVEAYERFLQGEFHYNRRSAGDTGRATDYYRQAIALDPAYARAWAALSGAYSLEIGEMDETTTQSLRQLQGEAARKAVELDPGLAVAHARLGQFYYHVQQPAKGDEHLRIAASLDPNEPLVLGFTASRAIWNGDYAQALELWRRAAAQDPLSPTVRANLGYMLMLNDRLDEALAECRRALELNPTAGSMLRTDVARILIQLGRYDEAISATMQLPEGNDRDYLLALLHRAPDRQQDANAALERLSAGPRDVLNTIHLAEVYVDRGRRDEAFELLAARYREIDRDRAARPRARWYFQDELRLSPYLKALHGDPRWARLATIPD